MRRGCCWGDGPSAPPRAHQAPTCQPRVEGRDPGAAWPWCPQLLMGRRQSSVEGRPALGLPLPCPAPARQLAQTQVSLPGGSQRLESPVVRARLGLMRPRLAGGLMSSWGKVGQGAGPPPPLGSSPSAGWCPYRPIFQSFIHSIHGSLPLSSCCPNLQRQPTPSTPQAPPTPHPRMLVRNADLIMSLPPQGLQRLPAPSWIEVHRPFELSLTCPSGP